MGIGTDHDGRLRYIDRMCSALEGPDAAVGCFLSYSHDDDLAMNGVATEIRTRIQLLYQAKTGRSIRIFVDRADIGWGIDWRDSITESVRNATASIPLITMNYFNREACREELMAYYSSANAIGVTQLVLPIVLAGATRISDSDPREEVRIIERLQFESLEEAWPRGFSSPEWLTALNKITEKLILALEAAEVRIAELESPQILAADVVRREPNDIDSNDPFEEIDGDSGVYLLLQEFSEASAKFAEVSPKAMEDLGTFSAALGESLGDFNAVTNKAVLRQKSILAARQLEGPSLQLEKSGTDFLTHVSAADGALRQVVAIVGDFDVRIMRESLNDQLSNIRAMVEDATEGVDLTEMDQVVEMVKLVGSMNVSLRRSIRPGHSGLAAIRDSMKIILSWRDIPLLTQSS